ncbi:hypothetical protein JOF39_001273 [Glutamicibacter protophormiae]|uniref:Uncharacterized protein n=1 Tax=Glutamicibacter protophormiae TaxID=37930 RepID=A0ABS4XNW0_GLUPR|nr:hypothetical protein [Glutamicibacter protophormiae]
MPQLHRAGQRQRRGAGHDDQVQPLDADHDLPAGIAVGGNPADQHQRQQSDAVHGGDHGQFHRPAAQRAHLVDHGHGPHARGEGGGDHGAGQQRIVPL